MKGRRAGNTCSSASADVKLVTIAGRSCQVVNTLRPSAQVSISYNGAEIIFDDPTVAVVT